MTFIGKAPGRAEWLGNHTDYNDGLVLGLGLDNGATAAITTCSDAILRMHAADLGEYCERRLDQLAPIAGGSWANYVIGVAAGFIKRGAIPIGIDIEIRSTVPMGSGLSSSAALECATARALQKAWDTHFDDLELAKIGQEAEHRYAGVRSGLLDQVTSLFAIRDHAVFFDCRSLEVRLVPVPHQARFVIVQSGVKHALSDGAYNARRQECEEAARVLGIAKLRDAAEEALTAAERSGSLRGTPLLRARHVVEENTRVSAALDALEAGDLVSIGVLMNQSHESSRTLFENSCDELDFLSGLARSLCGCYGARLTGGGFGGAVLSLVDAARTDAFVDAVKKHVREAWGKEPVVLVTGAGGAE